mmetsp:Transcript_8277/g.11562  ORF Transcript_8277/g.11562 Transcript_8277/m.11562 type:complete len:238 (-) Transcript_8277:195-908(-)
MNLVAAAAAIHQVRAAPDERARQNKRRLVEYGSELSSSSVSSSVDEDDGDLARETVEYRLQVGGVDYLVGLAEGRELQVTISPPDGQPPSVITLADLEWHGEQPLGTAYFDENGVVVAESVQYIGPLEGEDSFAVRYRGCELRVRGRSLQEASLEGYMLPPTAKRDTSQCVLSPMPGSLLSLAVRLGQQVVLGQPVAVVEAMKMQNVLRAPRSGVVRALPKEVGAHLKVDDVIVEFE